MWCFIFSQFDTKQKICGIHNSHKIRNLQYLYSFGIRLLILIRRLKYWKLMLIVIVRYKIVVRVDHDTYELPKCWISTCSTELEYCLLWWLEKLRKLFTFYSSCYRSTLVKTEGLLYDQLQLKDGVTPSAYSFIACSSSNFTI